MRPRWLPQRRRAAFLRGGRGGPGTHPAREPAAGGGQCAADAPVAWATGEALERLAAEVCENLRAYLTGRPRNLVN